MGVCVFVCVFGEGEVPELLSCIRIVRWTLVKSRHFSKYSSCHTNVILVTKKLCGCEMGFISTQNHDYVDDSPGPVAATVLKSKQKC